MLVGVGVVPRTALAEAAGLEVENGILVNATLRTSASEVYAADDIASRELIAFWVADGRLAAGMNINVWDVTEPIQALIRSRAPVDPARLRDPDVPLEALVPAVERERPS